MNVLGPLCALLFLLCFVSGTTLDGGEPQHGEAFAPSGNDHDVRKAISEEEMPTEPRRALGRIPSFFSNRNNIDKPSTRDQLLFSDLPGFGMRPPVADPAELAWMYRSHPGPSSSPVGFHAYDHSPVGGSMEYMTLMQRQVPALYVDGQGFLPISDPSIQPYVDPDVVDPSTLNSAFSMVPEYYLAPYSSTVSPLEQSSRVYDLSGSTTLAYPKIDHRSPIVVSAKKGWVREEQSHVIYFLEGDCSVRQGESSAVGPRAVVWIDKNRDELYRTREVTVYMDSTDTQEPLAIEMAYDSEKTEIRDTKWLGRFRTTSTVQTVILESQPPRSQEPAIYARAMEMMTPDHSVINQVQYVTEISGVKAPSPVRNFRRVVMSQRGDREIDFSFETYPDNRDRGIFVCTNGINLIIDGINGEGMLLGDTVDITADNAVIWMRSLNRMQPSSEIVEDEEEDYEVYLEGNIIFRDAARTIKANRLYYDAKNKIAYVLDGDLTTPIVGIQGINGTIRLKAEILQMLGEGMFSAKNTIVTTSMLGEPTYSLRSRNLTLNNQVTTPAFGGAEPVREQVLIAENNFVNVRQIPVFYWPWMAANLRDPTFYIKSISIGNSSIFGNQVKTRWNPFQILNIRNRPDWLDGTLAVDWLEKRGLGHGGWMTYQPSSCFGIPGQTIGSVYFWGINDKGLDTLGGARYNVTFPHKYRYRVHWKHRQQIAFPWKSLGDWTLAAQVGKTSDRNFFNNFFYETWHSKGNQTTSIDLTKHCGHSTLNLAAEYALDDFYTNANKLPRLTHRLLGQSLLNDRLTWYGQTRVGLTDYHTATAPYDWFNDGRYFQYLPWEVTTGSPTTTPPDPNNPNALVPETIDSTFEVFSTRHELDLPFNVGPIRCVPYVLGDFSHWGKDRSGKDVQRFYGQGGVRFNLPFWKIIPNCTSRTWYVNGVAHKVDLDAELSYARSDRNLDDLILTDSLDDWSIEDFRRRYTVTTFGPIGAMIPVRFDPRYYALRSGIGGNVTAGNMEIADDLTLCRFGVTQRWQTKRGPVGNRHIIDWITLSTHVNFYPENDHNYGKSIGLLDYNFLWHVGDRFSVFSSGLYDYFDGGQKITRIGTMWNRPRRGNFAVALDQLEGVVSRTYLTMSVGYTMNTKYSVSYSTAYDIRDKWQNMGHNFMFTRTGESFRFMIGAVYNEATRDWSFSFGLEPVFMTGLASRMQNMSSTMQQR